jgi:hypothetical protein
MSGAEVITCAPFYFESPLYAPLPIPVFRFLFTGEKAA